MRRLMLFAAGLAAAIAWLAPPATAGEAAKIDPEAQKLLRKVCDYYSSMKSFQVEAASRQDVSLGEKKQTHEVTGTLAARRPNQFAARVKHEGAEALAVSDGHKAWLFVAALKKYMSAEAPADLAVLLDDEGLHARLWNALDGGFLAVLLNPNAYETLLRDTESAQIMPAEMVGKARCRQIRFVQKRVDWALWVEDGPKPVIHKAWFDQSKMAAAMAGAPAGLKVEVIFDFRNWAVDSQLPEDTFRFAPPAGCEQVKTFVDEGPAALIGKPAPDFTLETLDGGKLKLADLKGKIVVLDFWTTWCPPCRKALPAVAEVADGYRQKGVVFYAINLAEAPDVVKKFVQDEKLKLTVALDRDGAVAKSYGVQAIPQTVIIGKDGTIQAVHVGMQPDTATQLKDELDALIAGKKLSNEGASTRSGLGVSDWGRPFSPARESNAAVKPEDK